MTTAVNYITLTHVFMGMKLIAAKDNPGDPACRNYDPQPGNARHPPASKQSRHTNRNQFGALKSAQRLRQVVNDGTQKGKDYKEEGRKEQKPSQKCSSNNKASIIGNNRISKAEKYRKKSRKRPSKST